MNTKTGLTTFVLTATLLAAGACGTEQPTAHSTGYQGAQTAANTAEDLLAAARQARAEHADAERWAHGHRTGSTTSCPVTPNPAERWVRNGIFLPECTQVRTRPIQQSADDRRQPVPVTYV
jgi:hypothetical protein